MSEEKEVLELQERYEKRIKVLEQMAGEAELVIKLLIAAGHISEEKVQQARDLAQSL